MNTSLRHEQIESGSLIHAPLRIQPALWPETGISTETATFVRISGPAGLSLTEGGIEFGLGGNACFDTYFNLFNLGKWRAHCGEFPLQLMLRGQGRFQLHVVASSQDRSRDRIYSEVVQIDEALVIPLDLTEITHPRTILFFELTALSEGRLDDFAWQTTQSPRQLPELTLSVTTFRREAAVASTVARFEQFMSQSPLKAHIRMNIVDNGQSLDLTSTPNVSIIRNENLGGAGGFSRGLLEARSAGATHCLFMDDDASVHMEAITRTWMFLAYALDPRTTVSGAMIHGDHRWQIWENGAVFNRGCKPQFFGTDMRDRPTVFEMEFDTTSGTPGGFYGGWWFFAFPIAYAKHMPFPFFVRGDDVSFSLANDFKFVTLPGIASVQESFTDKASPLTWYLDFRSHLAHHLSLPQKSLSWWRLQRMVVSFYVRTILRFHYESLAAVNLAMEDVLRGPQFFVENADMAKRRGDLKDMTQVEAWKPIQNPPGVRHSCPSRPLRALLLITLNGHLLPFSNRFGSHLVVEANERDNFRKIYGARAITFLNAHRTLAYTVSRDRRRFWQESLRLLRNTLRLRKNYQSQQETWQRSYPEITSKEFWEQKLGLR